jgi:glutathione synthase/RimK-type ligase-like ATP-grasp enzyme
MSIVLVHASLDDPHAKEVSMHLRQYGVSSVILARERCFHDWVIEIEDDEVIVRTSGSEWRSTDIRAVYWRQDFVVDQADEQMLLLEEQQRQFISDQRLRHVDSSFRSLSQTTPFLNTIKANRECSSKSLQQRVARKCGLKTPATFIGSSPGLAREFAERIWASGKRCCTKNIESTHAVIAGVKHARLTKIFSKEHLPLLDDLAICPMIFQEYIEKRCEYRVTVVGEHVFSCRIESQAAGGSTTVDWRNYNIPRTPHFAANLGPFLDSQLKTLVKTLGLTFGAIDLVENEHGEIFFLEVNSLGQWLWIEDLTEMPISRAVASYLADPQLLVRPPCSTN